MFMFYYIDDYGKLSKAPIKFKIHKSFLEPYLKNW